MLISNAEHAFIDSSKLTDYCLDPTHPIGRHKAVVFRRVLGFTKKDASALYELLLRAIPVYAATAGRLDEFGQQYTVDFPVVTSVGSATLRSAWIVRHDEDFPRLTTCFVLPG